jgi:hypothetical protein
LETNILVLFGSKETNPRYLLKNYKFTKISILRCFIYISEQKILLHIFWEKGTNPFKCFGLGDKHLPGI